jgi:N-acetylmuramoyl-L-alanine amidase
MADPQSYHFKLPSDGRPALFKIAERMYPDVTDYMHKRSSKRPGHPIESITTLVVHATAGGSSSGAMSVMETGKVKIGKKIINVSSSWHWLVPDENEEQHGKFVWACVYESLTANHVLAGKKHPDVNNGKSGINSVSLGIEIVNTQVSDVFSNWQVEMTAEIVRYCWAKYPNLVDIVSHAKLDPDRRTDPGKDFPWDSFKSYVLNGGPSTDLIAALGPIGVLPTKHLPEGGCCMA